VQKHPRVARARIDEGRVHLFESDTFLHEDEARSVCQRLDSLGEPGPFLDEGLDSVADPTGTKALSMATGKAPAEASDKWLRQLRMQPRRVRVQPRSARVQERRASVQPHRARERVHPARGRKLSTAGPMRSPRCRVP